jgi:hypothetical protein
MNNAVVVFRWKNPDDGEGGGGGGVKRGEPPAVDDDVLVLRSNVKRGLIEIEKRPNIE